MATMRSCSMWHGRLASVQPRRRGQRADEGRDRGADRGQLRSGDAGEPARSVRALRDAAPGLRQEAPAPLRARPRGPGRLLIFESIVGAEARCALATS
jgi:hypothetical protein